VAIEDYRRQSARASKRAVDPSRSSCRRGRSGATVATLDPGMGEANCVHCGDRMPRAEMRIGADGERCVPCDAVEGQAALAAVDPVLPDVLMGLATIPLLAGTVYLIVVGPHEAPHALIFRFLYVMGGVALWVGPLLGTIAAFKGFADLRLLVALADAVAPEPLPGFGLRRALYAISTLGGSLLAALTVGLWGLLIFWLA
jgi:hypothetical protein